MVDSTLPTDPDTLLEAVEAMMGTEFADAMDQALEDEYKAGRDRGPYMRWS